MSIPRSRSQSDFNGTQLSSDTSMMDHSYEDERRNIVEQIKSLLIAKIDTIHKTIPDIDLHAELVSVKNWRLDPF